MARREVVEFFRELLNTAIENGVGFSSRSRRSIEAALTEIEGVQLEDALRIAVSLREEEHSSQATLRTGSEPRR